MKDLKQGEIVVTFPSSTGYIHMVTTVARNAATIAGFEKSIAGKVAIATDEAVTNVIRHAYQGDPNKKVTIKFQITDDSLIIRIMHTGRALSKEDIKLPVMNEYIKKRRVGGLGLYIMNQFMDEVDYTVGKENCCQMTKYRK